MQSNETLDKTQQAEARPQVSAAELDAAYGVLRGIAPRALVRTALEAARNAGGAR